MSAEYFWLIYGSAEVVCLEIQFVLLHCYCIQRENFPWKFLVIKIILKTICLPRLHLGLIVLLI